MSAVPVRTVTTPAPVTGVNVTSYGTPVRVVVGPVREVTVRESISFAGDTAPTVTSGALTAIADGGGVVVRGSGTASIDSGGGPVSATAVQGTLTVTADGGGIIAAGTDGADLNSGGGPVSAAAISGPLTVTTDGGGLEVNGVTGSFNADTGSGPVNARGIAAATTRVNTDSGGAWISYSRAPQAVQVATSGGPAALELPGGPYAVTAESGGGPEQVSVLVGPDTHGPSSASTALAGIVSVTTDGGALQITPPGAGG